MTDNLNVKFLPKHYPSQNSWSPRAMVMHVRAAKTPNIIGLTVGMQASNTAIPDHAAPIHRYAGQKLPLFAKKATEEMMAQQG